MKKNGESRKNGELDNKVNMNIFEKNPKKGGTPAIEKNTIISDFVKNEL